MKPNLTLAAALSLALVACTNDDASRDGVDTTVAATQPAQSGTAPAPATTGDENAARGAGLAAGDRNALLAVQEVDRHEVAAAEDALAKNVQGEVRAYAETLRDEHGRNLETTRRLLGGVAGETPGGQHYAENRPNRDIALDGGGTPGTDAREVMDGAPGTDGAQAVPPEIAAMRDRHDAERQRLAALEGEGFRREWLAAMVKGHEEALAKLDNELIPGASDPAVTAHLQTTRAAISRHLDTARSLHDTR